MLDTASLRVAFSVLAFTMLILFYFTTYRSTRSPYCGWWCVALALFLGGSSAYLLDGTAQQYWSNPLGNAMLVLGGAAVWAGARTLRASRPPSWQLALAPVLTFILSCLDHPATNTWSGGYIFLFAMSATIGLCAVELWRVEHTDTSVHIMLAVSAGFISFYYFLRWIVYLFDGSEGHVFAVYLGSPTTTLLNLALLGVVSYSMSELSHEQSTKELTARATRDGLTGLLNRTEFLRLAHNEAQNPKRSLDGAALILADLDHFKSINDTYGHPAGDRVLEAFAAACLASVRSTDLIGRYGGDEFILLLPGMTLVRAEQTAAQINLRLQESTNSMGIGAPTASYGVGHLALGANLDEAISSVDAALYRAKQLGPIQIAHEDDATTELKPSTRAQTPAPQP